MEPKVNCRQAAALPLKSTDNQLMMLHLPEYHPHKCLVQAVSLSLTVSAFSC